MHNKGKLNTVNGNKHNACNFERNEYISSLQCWIYKMCIWQNSVACFSYLIENQCNNSRKLTHRDNGLSNNYNVNHSSSPDIPRQTDTTLHSVEGFEFSIPPIWKRIVAEGVDFIILFIVKLVLTLVVLELLDRSDWNIIKENMAINIIEMSFDADFTNGLILLEALHRVIVCIYEIYWLHGTTEIPFGCATPGKALMGLTVVVATKIKDIEPNNPNSSKVLVYPGKDLGFIIAAGRAFIKNILLALMFPFCFAMFIFQFNRTGYDIMCNTVVVEYDPNPPKRNWP